MPEGEQVGRKRQDDKTGGVLRDGVLQAKVRLTVACRQQAAEI